MHYLIDDRSGFKIKNTDAVKEWDGLIVQRGTEDPKPDFRARPPREYVVKDPRPETKPVFVGGIYGPIVRPEDL